MKLYDNDAYFDEFKDGVYDLFADDPTWDRANQIIDLFLNAPEVDAAPVDDPPNAPLTLEELREMDGEIVTIETIPLCAVGMVDIEKNVIFYLGGKVDLDGLGIDFLAYRRKPDKVTL